MEKVGAFEAKNKFSELLDRVERGEEIMITRRGRPVARLSAPETNSKARVKAALKRMRDLRVRLRAEGVTFSAEEIRELRDEGRR